MLAFPLWRPHDEVLFKCNSFKDLCEGVAVLAMSDGFHQRVCAVKNGCVLIGHGCGCVLCAGLRWWVAGGT
jgi:hypothetical protein